MAAAGVGKTKKLTASDPFDEDGRPPLPDVVTTPVKIFDWGNDVTAIKHAQAGGIALLTVPKHVNMKGKKLNKPAVLIYARDRDMILIFKQWIKADDKCLSGNVDSGPQRWRLLVGGKSAKKALSYINS